jgi:PAS domain S-box-containing protein
VPHPTTALAALDVRGEDFLASVLETAAQPIWVAGPDDVIRFANPAAIAALGYDSAAELLGRCGHDTIHSRHPDGPAHPAAECPISRTRAAGETVACELDWFVRRDGSMLPVSYVSAPIAMPDGRGAVVAFSEASGRVRGDELRREHEAMLAAQRRVATLVAGGAPSAEVFTAIAREVGRVVGLPLVALWRYDPDGTAATVLGAWGECPHPFEVGTRWPLDGPTVCNRVLETGAPVRIDDFATLPGVTAAAARDTGIYACAGAPIIVDGEVWGAMSADSTDRIPLPDEIEDRLAEFTELVATAISDTASRVELARLADEQAALRRVATLVARGVPPPEVFAAVAREVGRLLGVDATHMARYEADGTATGIAAWSPGGRQAPVGTRVGLEGDSVTGSVFRTGRPVRVNDYCNAPGPAAALGRELGLRSSVGAPIVVDQRLWGVMIASSKADQLPLDAEARIAAFTELVATAISNTEVRMQVARLAEEQAALRRVATLVAQGVPPGELVRAVTEEAGTLLGAEFAGMGCHESDDTVTVVATWAATGEHPDVGAHWPLEQGDLATKVRTTGRPARMDGNDGLSAPRAAVREQLGIRSSVASPILVEGRPWGELSVHSTQAEPLPPDTESRLMRFTDLVATAMSNARARAEVQRLADEQAALRRVATLVARESSPAEVFAAVAEEVSRLLCIHDTAVFRYEDDKTVTLIANAKPIDPPVRVGGRRSLDGESVAGRVQRTGRPARIDDYEQFDGPLAADAHNGGIRSGAGAPITVDGRLWGVIVVGSPEQLLPAGTEERIGQFTELVATAISNVEAHRELAASRARIVAATDDERRRVVRDLHDGAQQRLVHSIITLKMAHRALQTTGDRASELVSEALDQAERANVELRELAHGILPAVLTRGGLRAGAEALASRMPVPVELAVSVERLPAPVEATAYFVVAESLTNVAKHSGATTATVRADIEDGTLRLRVRDDGVGGARTDGTGLVGLADRLAALDGRLRVESPAGGGTLVAADIPVPRD